MGRTLTFNLNEMELREDSEQGRDVIGLGCLQRPSSCVCRVAGETLGRDEEEKPGRSGCDPLVGGENRGGGRSVCPRSFESRADRFADGFGVGSEMKGRDQG